MKELLLVATIIIFTNCDRKIRSNPTEKANTKKSEISDNKYEKQTVKKMQGTWVHEEDSLAIVEIQDLNWTFKYIGIELEDNERYKIAIIDTVPPFVDRSTRTLSLILANKEDTMSYEIITLTDSIMNLMFHPRGNTHIYRRIK